MIRVDRIELEAAFDSRDRIFSYYLDKESDGVSFVMGCGDEAISCPGGAARG